MLHIAWKVRNLRGYVEAWASWWTRCWAWVHELPWQEATARRVIMSVLRHLYCCIDRCRGAVSGGRRRVSIPYRGGVTQRRAAGNRIVCNVNRVCDGGEVETSRWMVERRSFVLGQATPSRRGNRKRSLLLTFVARNSRVAVLQNSQAKVINENYCDRVAVYSANLWWLLVEGLRYSGRCCVPVWVGRVRLASQAASDV